MPELTAHHVGLTVSELETAVEFYRDVLGLPVLDRFEVDGPAFETVVGIDGASGRFIHLDAGGGRIELVEYVPVGADQPDAGLNQPGASHIGLAIDDLDGFLEGVPDTVDCLSEPQTTESGTRLVFLRDPDGNLVELLEA